MSKKEKEVEEVEETTPKNSSERARRLAIVEAYKKENPAKADKLVLSNGKMVSLDQWAKEV